MGRYNHSNHNALLDSSRLFFSDCRKHSAERRSNSWRCKLTIFYDSISTTKSYQLAWIYKWRNVIEVLLFHLPLLLLLFLLIYGDGAMYLYSHHYLHFPVTPWEKRILLSILLPPFYCLLPSECAFKAQNNHIIMDLVAINTVSSINECQKILRNSWAFGKTRRIWSLYKFLSFLSITRLFQMYLCVCDIINGNYFQKMPRSIPEFWLNVRIMKWRSRIVESITRGGRNRQWLQPDNYWILFCLHWLKIM